MSQGINKVMLLGHLGADAELRHTQSGSAVLNLRVATTERYQDRDDQWKERTEWHSCVVWGKRAEALAKILVKGSGVFVEGSLRTSSYDDRDGNKRYKTEINAQQVLLTGRGGGGDSDGGYGGDGGDEPPARTGGYGGAPRGAGGGRPPARRAAPPRARPAPAPVPADDGGGYGGDAEGDGDGGDGGYGSDGERDIPF